jgi:hypothetical protein
LPEEAGPSKQRAPHASRRIEVFSLGITVPMIMQMAAMPRPLQMRAPIWLSRVPSAIARLFKLSIAASLLGDLVKQ